MNSARSSEAQAASNLDHDDHKFGLFIDSAIVATVFISAGLATIQIYTTLFY